MAGECGPTGQPLALAAGVEILAAAAGTGFWQAGPHPSGSGERKCVFSFLVFPNKQKSKIVSVKYFIVLAL